MALSDEELHNPEQRRIYCAFLEKQRAFLLEENKDPALNEDLVRRQLYLIDLEEERINNSQL